MSNVYRIRSHRFPSDTRKCLERLLAHVDDQDRPIAGIAFIAYIDDSGFIADACGKARLEIHETRLMLRSLDAKLARWEKK